MAAPSKQPQPTKKSGGGWGSLLSGAVAGLESRLDTILANEEGLAEASVATAKAASKPGQRPASGSGSGSSLVPPPGLKDAGSRDVSRTRTNERLAERLAKATAVKTPSAAGSAVPSRSGTPVNERQSGEEKRKDDGEGEQLARSVPNIAEPVPDEGGEAAKEENTAEDGKEQDTKDTEDETVSLAAPRQSIDSSSRPSTDFVRESMSSRPSSDLPNGSATLASKSAAEYEAELHTYMEKIDALQSKLSYLANSTVAAAKAANASSDSSATDKQLAEKDERIALLMQEGEKLSKTELRHLQTIKKLRAQRVDEDKTAAEVKRKFDKTETALRQRLQKAEQAERTASEKNKVIAGIEKEVDALRVDRERASELVRTLTVQLKEAKDRAEKAEKEARDKGTSEADKGRIAGLENDLEDAQIEKKLTEDRATAEMKKVREDIESQQQRFSVRELELKNEIAGLESRLEALRSRAEEQGIDGASSGESSVQLLRQVETLQRQYSVAKENWEAIEASLNGRLGSVERERDEMGKREVEARKRVREAGIKARRAEEELESKEDEARRRNEELENEKAAAKVLQERLEETQKAAEDARAESERQRKVWDVELQQRVEEERVKWSQGRAMQHAPMRNQSPTTHNSRKVSTTDGHALHSSSRRPGTNRLASHELANLHTYGADTSRPVSRRSFGLPPPRQGSSHVNNNPSALEHSSEVSPSISRQESTLSLTTPGDIPPTPSFDANNHSNAYGFPDAPVVETPHTPDENHTLADLLSTSTAPAAGPSVQLVERMSLLVRRLESEKAGFKDEIARLSSQRDSARDEVVTLMREVEGKRDEGKKVSALEEDMEQLKRRYEASLEMLGEREEEVGELKGDVAEMKRLYRELVERKVGN